MPNKYQETLFINTYLPRIEVKDIPEENIMKHWEATNDFINNCRNENGKVRMT